jgi:putative oxidoreductase
MKDVARLILRLVLGALMAGHGGQKLFGWFGGSGVEGTAGMMKSLEMHPPRQWALLAGLSEFGGGVLTAVGALSPLGPLGIMGAMSMATAKVHWGKPIWNAAGGAELPITNMAAAAALAIAGPGRYSLDRMLGIRLPRWMGLLGLIAIGISVGRAMQPVEQPVEQPARGGQQGSLQAREQLEDAQTQAAQEAEKEGSLL